MSGGMLIRELGLHFCLAKGSEVVAFLKSGSTHLYTQTTVLRFRFSLCLLCSEPQNDIFPYPTNKGSCLTQALETLL
jgi:hypothetical protein